MDSVLIPVISAGLSAIISYYVTLNVKDKEYKNDYYKKVIDKRILAYEKLEKLIAVLHLSIMNEGVINHKVIFSSKENFELYREATTSSMHMSMWLGMKTYNQLSELNSYINSLKTKHDFNTTEGLKAAGKEGHNKIHQMKNELESLLRNDMYNLHNVDRFFRSRK